MGPKPLEETGARWGRTDVIFVLNAAISAGVIVPHTLLLVLPRDLLDLWNNPNWFSGLLALWSLFATVWGLPATILGLAVTFVLADSGRHMYAGISLILALACSIAWMPLFVGG